MLLGGYEQVRVYFLWFLGFGCTILFDRRIPEQIWPWDPALIREQCVIELTSSSCSSLIGSEAISIVLELNVSAVDSNSSEQKPLSLGGLLHSFPLSLNSFIFMLLSQRPRFRFSKDQPPCYRISLFSSFHCFQTSCLPKWPGSETFDTLCPHKRCLSIAQSLVLRVATNTGCYQQKLTKRLHIDR